MHVLTNKQMKWWESEVDELREQLRRARGANMAVGDRLEKSVACCDALAKQGRTYLKAARGLDREKKKLIERVREAERELSADALRIAELEAELKDRENTIEWMAEQTKALREEKQEAAGC